MTSLALWATANAVALFLRFAANREIQRARREGW